MRPTLSTSIATLEAARGVAEDVGVGNEGAVEGKRRRRDAADPSLGVFPDGDTAGPALDDQRDARCRPLAVVLGSARAKTTSTSATLPFVVHALVPVMR